MPEQLRLRQSVSPHWRLVSMDLADAFKCETALTVKKQSLRLYAVFMAAQELLLIFWMSVFAHLPNPVLTLYDCIIHWLRDPSQGKGTLKDSLTE